MPDLLTDIILGRPAKFIRLTVEGVNGESEAEFLYERWLAMNVGQRKIEIHNQCWDATNGEPFDVVGHTIK